MASLLADQGTLADLSSKFSGRIPVRIHFLDNSSKVFLSEPSMTIKDLVNLCLEKFSIHDKDFVLPYYGLFESKNGGAIDGHLAMDLKVHDVLQSWADAGVQKTAKFLFMIRLFLQSNLGLEPKDVVAQRLGYTKEDVPVDDFLANAATTDPNALHLQFIQAVYNVITGRYPTTVEEALTLGAVHFLLKFGPFKSEKHKSGFLGARIFEFIPVKHLKSGSSGSKGLSASSTSEWENRLLQTAQRLFAEEGRGVARDEDNGQEEAEGDAVESVVFQLSGRESALSPQRRYLELLLRREGVFGASFFKVSQKTVRALPESLQIAVHSEGLYLLDKHKSLPPLRSFHIEDIFRWGFKPAVMFYFEVQPDDSLGTGTLEFDTAEGKTMSDLLTDYALSFLKEREREEARAAQTPRRPANPQTRSQGQGQGANRVRSKPALSPEAAAVKLQALFRGFSLRNDWAREDAAILLQAVYRGYRARVLISKLIENMLLEGQLG